MINGMRIRSLAVLCAVVLSASGCGTGQAGGQEDRPAALEEGAMGRYVETFYELPEEINRNGGLNWLSDGTLLPSSVSERDSIGPEMGDRHGKKRRQRGFP